MGAHSRPVSRTRRGLALLTPAALVASSFVVYQASNAAFSASTNNGSNSWSAGSVVLADDDSGNVMFNVTGMVPGATATKCINVNYTGNVAVGVKLYVSPFTDNGLGQYLDFKVEEGSGASGGSSGSCTGFAPSSTLLSNTLAQFGTTNTTYATGLGSWAPSAPAGKSYRFTYTLQDNSAAQGKDVQATFVWEARTS